MSRRARSTSSRRSGPARPGVSAEQNEQQDAEKAEERREHDQRCEPGPHGDGRHPQTANDPVPSQGADRPHAKRRHRRGPRSAGHEPPSGRRSGPLVIVQVPDSASNLWQKVH